MNSLKKMASLSLSIRNSAHTGLLGLVSLSGWFSNKTS